MATLYAARDGNWGGSPAVSDLYSLDPVTAVPSSIGPIGYAVTSLAFDPATGFLYGSSSPYTGVTPDPSLIRVNTATGAGTLVGSFGLPANLFSQLELAFTQAGVLYGYNTNTADLYTINVATGVATLVGNSGSSAPYAVEFDAAGNLYGLLYTYSGASFWKVNTATAALTTIGLIGTTPLSSNVMTDAAFDGSGQMWAIVGFSDNSLVKVDPDGTITLVGVEGALGATNEWSALAWDNEVKPNPWYSLPTPPPGSTLYAALGGGNTTSDLYTVNPSTGEMMSVGPIGFAITGLAIDPTSGIMYGLTSNNSGANPHSLISIDMVTGAGTLIGPETPSRTPWTDIAFDSTGQLYAQGQNTHLMRVDKTTGIAVDVGGTGLSVTGGALAIDSTDTGYAVTQQPLTGRPLRSVNLSTGVYTSLASFTGFTSSSGMGGASFDGNDVFWGIINSKLVVVSVATSFITLIATTNISGFGTVLDVDGLCWLSSVTPPTDDFSVTLTPSSLTVFRGASDTTALSTTVTVGVPQSVTLSDTGAPTGVTLSYAANPIMSGGGTTVTVTVGPTASPGVYPITIHADGTETSHLATLTLTIPGPIDDAFSMFENGSPLVVAAPGVMANDIDPTTVSLVSGPAVGTLVLHADGSFTYTPPSYFFGTVTWVYSGNGGTATVTITVATRTPRAVFSNQAAFAAAA